MFVFSSTVCNPVPVLFEPSIINGKLLAWMVTALLIVCVPVNTLLPPSWGMTDVLTATVGD